MSTFRDQADKIKSKYKDLNEAHPNLLCGWRFLYTPANTFTCPNRLMFLGLNPACNSIRDSTTINTAIEEVKAGNAYLVEPWGKNLQIQVTELFKKLALSRVGDRASNDFEKLMNETLTSNFCPFQSHSWDKLPKDVHNEVVAFSTDLWTGIIPEIKPRLILCMGSLQYPYLKGILDKIPSESFQKDELETNWGKPGKIKFAICQYKFAEWTTTLARFPHLSTYKLLGSEKCRSNLDKFIAQLADAAV